MKLKKGIFVGPQIRALMSDAVFNSKLNSGEKSLDDEYSDIPFACVCKINISLDR